MNCSKCKTKPPVLCCKGCTTSNGQVQLCPSCFFDYHVGDLAAAHRPTAVSQEILRHTQEQEKMECLNYLEVAKRCSNELESLIKSGESGLIRRDFMSVKSRINLDSDAIISRLTFLTNQVNKLRSDAITAASNRYQQKRINLVEVKRRLDDSVGAYNEFSARLDAMSGVNSTDELLQQYLELNKLRPGLERCIPPRDLTDSEPIGWHALPNPAQPEILACLNDLERRIDQLNLSNQQQLTGTIGQSAFDLLGRELQTLAIDESGAPLRCRLLSNLSSYGVFTACQDSPVREELISHIESDLQLRRAVEPDFQTMAEYSSDLRNNQRIYAKCRDGCWRRGRILLSTNLQNSSTSTSVAVRLVDIGETENVTRDRLVDAVSDNRYSNVPELSFECCLAEPTDIAVLTEPLWLADRIGGPDQAFMLRAVGQCQHRSRRVFKVKAWPHNPLVSDDVSEKFALALTDEFVNLLRNAVAAASTSNSMKHRDIRLQTNPDLPREVHTFTVAAPVASAPSEAAEVAAAASNSLTSLALNTISPFEDEFSPLIRLGFVRPLTEAECSNQNGICAYSDEEDMDDDQVVVFVDRSAVLAASLPGSQVTSPTSSLSAQQQHQLPMLQQQQQPPQTIPMFPQQLSLPMHPNLHHHPQSIMLPPPQVSQSLPAYNQHPPTQLHHQLAHHPMSLAPSLSDYAAHAPDYGAHNALYAAPPHHLPQQPQQQPRPQHHVLPPHFNINLSYFVSAGQPQQHAPPPPPHNVYGQHPHPSGYLPHHHPQHPTVTMSMAPPVLPVMPLLSEPVNASNRAHSNGNDLIADHQYYYTEPRPDADGTDNPEFGTDEQAAHAVDNGGEDYDEEEQEDYQEEEEEEEDNGDDNEGEECDEADEEYHEAEDSIIQQPISRSATWEEEVAADEAARAILSDTVSVERCDRASPSAAVDNKLASPCLKNSATDTAVTSAAQSPSTEAGAPSGRAAVPAAGGSSSKRFNTSWQLGSIIGTLQKRATSPETVAARQSESSASTGVPPPQQQQQQSQPENRMNNRPCRTEERGRGGVDRSVAATKRSGGGSGGKQQQQQHRSNNDRPMSSAGRGGPNSGLANIGGGGPSAASSRSGPRLGNGGGGGPLRQTASKGPIPIEKQQQPLQHHYQHQQQNQQQQSKICRHCGQYFAQCRCQLNADYTGGVVDSSSASQRSKGRGGRKDGGGGGGTKSSRGHQKTDRRPSDSGVKKNLVNAVPATTSPRNIVTGEWET